MPHAHNISATPFVCAKDFEGGVSKEHFHNTMISLAKEIQHALTEVSNSKYEVFYHIPNDVTIDPFRTLGRFVISRLTDVDQ